MASKIEAIKIGDYDIKITGDGVTVGCTFVSRVTVEQILKAIKKAPRGKFYAGVKVKVVKIINDSEAVLGRIGYVTRVESDFVCVRFPRWNGGHNGEESDSSIINRWYVKPDALKVVKK